MTENLNKVPRRSILKHNDSEDHGFSGPPIAAAPVSSSLNMMPSEANLGRKSSKTATFDEMNILLTLHPPDKDYGHMKIEEPKTPYSYAYLEDEEAEAAETDASQGDGASGHQRRGSFGDGGGGGHDIDPSLVASRFRAGSDALPSVLKPGSPDEEMENDDRFLSDEERRKRREFEAKRKAHYNEYMAVKMARKLIEEEDDDEEDE